MGSALVRVNFSVESLMSLIHIKTRASEGKCTFEPELILIQIKVPILNHIKFLILNRIKSGRKKK